MILPDVSLGQTGHAGKHNEERRLINQFRQHEAGGVYSSDYATLQAAIDAVLGTPAYNANGSMKPRVASKTLVIMPGEYDLMQPLKIISAIRMYIVMNHVTLHAAADMPSLIDMTGCSFCRIEANGLWMDTRPGMVVQDMLLLQNDLTIASTTTGKNEFTGLINIGGGFVNGVRVGRDGDSTQCDQAVLHGLNISGDFSGDFSVLHQHGIILGSNVGGNNLIHRLQDSAVWACRVGISVRSTNAMIENITCTNNVTDIVMTANSMCCAKYIRSEGSQVFLSTPHEGIGESTSWASTLVLEDSFWASSNVRSDGIFMNLTSGGTFDLSRVFVFWYEGQPPPRIHSTPAVPLYLHVNGLAVSHVDVLSPAEAPAIFQRSANVCIEGVVMQINDGAGLVAMQKINMPANWSTP
jgi:hypothetical protein